MFTDQMAPYLQTLNTPTTHQAYQISLQQFHDW